jgi:glycogen synthase
MSECAVLEEARILAITKIVCNLMEQNGIGRQRYELSKELQEPHVDVALFSETYLKPHEMFFISNYDLY